MMPTIQHSEKSKTVEIIKRSVFYRGCGWEQKGGRDEQAENKGF